MISRRSFLLASAGGFLATQERSLAQSTTPAASEFLTEIPAYPGNMLLARPTDRSMTLNVCVANDCLARVSFGRARDALTQRSAEVALRAGEPKELVLRGLTPNTAYGYELQDARSGKPIPPGSAGSFHTARPAGGTFTFTVQADSHLDEGCRTDVYRQTIANQLADEPDFMIDMGDTSMAGKHPSRESALKQFLAQRYYFGLIGHRVPSFLLVGNHDGEEAKMRGTTDPDGLAVWSNAQRKRFFTNPVPDDFYTGNSQPHLHAGLLQNYYAWTWGDALFVLLDPYWTSSAARGQAAGWSMSLGKLQYDWLATTLERSDARHKVVLIHQLVGGLDQAGRGGAEAADYFEWGGHELDGRDTFAERRPGWAMPIHALLRQHGVNLVLHGHDHFFADQSKDGIVYVLVPQAAHRNFRRDHAEEYGYRAGHFSPNSGHLRLRVSTDVVRIEYVRSVPPSIAAHRLRNGEVVAAIEVQSGKV